MQRSVQLRRLTALFSGFYSFIYSLLSSVHNVPWSALFTFFVTSTLPHLLLISLFHRQSLWATVRHLCLLHIHVTEPFTISPMSSTIFFFSKCMWSCDCTSSLIIYKISFQSRFLHLPLLCLITSLYHFTLNHNELCSYCCHSLDNADDTQCNDIHRPIFFSLQNARRKLQKERWLS